jgi:hypothetical protein
VRVKQRLETTAVAWLPMAMCLSLYGFLGGWPLVARCLKEAESIAQQQIVLSQQVARVQEARAALEETLARKEQLLSDSKSPGTAFTNARMSNRETLFATLLESLQRNSLQCLGTSSSVDEKDSSILHQKMSVLGAFGNVSQFIQEVTESEPFITPTAMVMNRPADSPLCEWQLEFELGGPSR